MNTDAPTAGGYLVGVVAAVHVDAIQTRTGRRSIRGAVAFAGGSGVECRICGAREWLLVPTLGHLLDGAGGHRREQRPPRPCVHRRQRRQLRPRRPRGGRPWRKMERAEHMTAHAVIDAEAIGPAAAREALARLI